MNARTVRPGDYITHSRMGYTQKVVSIGEFMVMLRSHDGFDQAVHSSLWKSLDDILKSYRLATPDEVTTYHDLALAYAGN